MWPVGQKNNCDLLHTNIMTLHPRDKKKLYTACNGSLYFHNKDTSATQTLGSVPLVSILRRFDCMVHSFYHLLMCPGIFSENDLMVFYWVRKDFWLLHYWYQRFPQHPLLILNHLRSLQAPAILINNIYCEQKLCVRPGSDTTPLICRT